MAGLRPVHQIEWKIEGDWIEDIQVSMPIRPGSGYPMSEATVMLWIRAYKLAPSINFLDLTGNRERTGLANRGIGTALVNAALQYLQGRYGPETPVSGRLSTVDDPRDDDAVARKCDQRRRHFWRSFGFVVCEDSTRPEMSAKLDDLHVKLGRPIDLS